MRNLTANLRCIQCHVNYTGNNAIPNIGLKARFEIFQSLGLLCRQRMVVMVAAAAVFSVYLRRLRSKKAQGTFRN